MSVELTIDKLGGEGDGIARHDGQPVFVPFALPGEVVRVELQRGKDHMRAKLLEIVTSSAARVQPACKHFTRCGGCRAQHMAPGFYSEWKQAKLTHALEKAGIRRGIDAVMITRPHSRRRVTLTAAKKNGDIVLGFNARASHVLINIEECPVSRDAIVSLLNPLRSVLAELMPDDQALDVHVAEHDGNTQIVFIGIAFGRAQQETITRWATAHGVGSVYMRSAENGLHVITETAPPTLIYEGFRLQPPPGGFLQASAEIERAMQEDVAAHVNGAKKIADLFCGSGAFTFAVAKGRAVWALDADGAALDALKHAAKATNTIRIEKRNLFNEPLSPMELSGWDAVVIDPPRVGAEAQMKNLAKSKVKTVVSVSCNPQSFARDSALLIAGGYTLRHLKLYDQFLWSPHMEMIGVFGR